MDTATGETTKEDNPNVTNLLKNPANKELTLQDNAAPMSDYNYINESLILFSSNIVNKLKAIEYNVLENGMNYKKNWIWSFLESLLNINRNCTKFSNI